MLVDGDRFSAGSLIVIAPGRTDDRATLTLWITIDNSHVVRPQAGSYGGSVVGARLRANRIIRLAPNPFGGGIIERLH